MLQGSSEDQEDTGRKKQPFVCQGTVNDQLLYQKYRTETEKVRRVGGNMNNSDKNRLSFYERHKDELRVILAAIIFLLSLIGSSQYYTAYYDGSFPSVFRLLVAIFNSTLSLFLANPTVGIGKTTPWAYEAARFLAPLLTTYCVYKLIQETLLRYAGSLKRLFDRSNEIIIFGHNRFSAEFIDKLIDENKSAMPADQRNIILISSRPVDSEDRLEYEKKGVSMCSIDLYISETEGNVQRAKRQNALEKLDFEKTKEVVFFEEDQTINFALFGDFLDIAKNFSAGGEPIRCSLYAENRTIRQAVSDLFDSYISEGHDNITLVLFSISELEVLNMLEKHRFHESVFEILKDKADTEKVSIQDIPDVHILIAGLGSCGMMVFEKALQTAVLKNLEKGKANLTITIVDRDENVKKKVKTHYPMADKVATVHYINQNIEREGLEITLDKYPQITYAAVCFSNQTSSYLMMDRIRKFITAENIRHNDDPAWMKDLCVPIAIRMETNNSYLPFLTEKINKNDTERTRPEYTVFDFGNIADIYTVENIMRSSLDEKAAVFNHNYQILLTKINDPWAKPVSVEKDWNDLNYERRESNRAVVLNAPYFHDLIHLIHADKELVSESNISEWDIQTNDMLARINNTVTEELVRLEHQRWCGFYYSYGFVGPCENAKDNRKYMFAEEDGKAVYGQVHNCLVDYERLKEKTQTANTIHYDLANVYQYSSYQE